MTSKRATTAMTIGWRAAVQIGALVLLPAAVWAACSLTPGNQQPPNIILIVADNLGWVELPYFSPPIDWSGTTYTGQYRLMRPDLNRLAARMMAKPGGTPGTFNGPALSGSPTPTPFTVRPLETVAGYSTSGAQSCECTSNCNTGGNPPTGCKSFADQLPSPPPLTSANVKSTTDALTGFGGLRQLIDHGIRFDRFYSPGGECEPARASILTGRHVQRHGIVANGSPGLPAHEVTIAEYLKQGCRAARADCRNSDPTNPQLVECPCFLQSTPPAAGAKCMDPLPTAVEAPCYTTGMIGKWNLGTDAGSLKVPWKQGFDEAIYFKKYVGDYTVASLFCSPKKGSASCCPNGAGWYVGGAAPTPTSCSAIDCCVGDPFQGTLAIPPPPTNNPLVDECYENAGTARTAGCNYSTRLYRDLARNFITRHRLDMQPSIAPGAPPGTMVSKPFFLLVTVNATQVAVAPRRTAFHYGSADENRPLWGALEELDAAVGQIVQEVKDQGMANNTVVLFTSDNGTDTENNHGNPLLRGMYRSMDEGGIRVGLVGSACGLGQTVTGTDTGGHVANHVDLFPTIAEAAGAPLPPTPVLRSASGGLMCSGGDCISHYVDGTSFFGMMLAAAQPTPTPLVDFAYSQFTDRTIISRGGVFAYPTPGANVCAFAEFNADKVPIRAGSCQSCSGPGDTSCTTALCAVLGAVCVDSSVRGQCKDGNPPTNAACEKDDKTCNNCVYTMPAGGFRRCRGAVGESGYNFIRCPTGQKCVNVHTNCNSCVPAAWKLTSKGYTPKELFDLRSNPEEDVRLNCLSNTQLTATGGIKDQLKARLDRWGDCSKNNPTCNSASCAPKRLADPTPPCH